MILSFGTALFQELGIPDEESFRIVAKAGFAALDYSLIDMTNDTCIWNSDRYADHANDVLALAQRNGLSIRQAHAPFKFPWDTSENVTETVALPRIVRAIEICSLLKAPHIIVHPLYHAAVSTTKEQQHAANVAFYRSLQPAAERFGVRIALENLYRVCTQPQDYLALLNELDPEWFIACVDIGHCHRTGVHADDMIKTLGDRMRALHVHDNHGDADEHLLPGMGTVRWDAVMHALNAIRYHGDFTYEVLGSCAGLLGRGYGFDGFCEEALGMAYRIGNHLIKAH